MDYTELDKAIIEAIGGGCTRFSAIVFRVRAETDKLGFKSGTKPQRAVDRRLQAMRKTEKILYEDGKWKLRKGQ